MSRSPTLTGVTANIYQFVSEFITTNGMPPTLREIADAQFLSVTGVSWHLNKLERMGLIIRNDSKRRSIRLVEIQREK